MGARGWHTKPLSAPSSAHRETLSQYYCSLLLQRLQLSPTLLLVHCSGCIAIFPPTTPADPHTPLHSITAPLNTRQLLAGSQLPQIRHHDFCTPQTPEEDRALQRQLLCSMHHRWHHWYLTPLPPKNTRTPTNNHSLRPNAHRRHAS